MSNFRESFEYELNHSLVGQKITETYEIVDQIYSSDETRIYRIKDRDNLKIKVLKAHRKQASFAFEMDKILALDHDGIAGVEAFFESEHYIYLIKEYIEGEDLETYVQKYGPMSVQRVKSIMTSLCGTLSYLHSFESGAMVYRDLKPSNIIINQDKRPILIDIVTVRELKSDQDSDTYYVGSRGYSAPEQFGFMQSSPSADIYSLGATMFYLLTGIHPKSTHDFKTQLSLVEVNDRQLERIILRATRFNPDQRYQEIIALERDLEKRNMLKWLLVPVASLVLASSIYVGYGMWGQATNEMHGSGSNSNTALDESELKNFEETMSSSEDDLDQAIEEEMPPIEESNENNVDVSKVFEVSKGWSFSIDPNLNMSFTFDQEDMIPSQSGFAYLKIVTSDVPFALSNLQNEIENINPDELQEYNDGAAQFSLGQDRNFLMMIYDKDQQVIGYSIQNNIVIEGDENIVVDESMDQNDAGASQSDTPVNEETSVEPSYVDVDTSQLALIESGLSWTVLPDSSVQISFNRDVMSTSQKSFKYAKASSGPEPFAVDDLIPIIEEAVASNHGVFEYDKNMPSSAVTSQNNNLYVIIFDENMKAIGYTSISNINLDVLQASGDATSTRPIEEANEPPTMFIDLVNSPDDVDLSSIPIIEAVSFEFTGDHVVTIIDREMLLENQKDFRYISVNSNDIPYNDSIMKSIIYQSAVKGYGFQVYDGQGYNSNITGCDSLAVVIYDKYTNPVGYYVYNNFRDLAIPSTSNLESITPEIFEVSDGVVFKIYSDQAELVFDHDKLPSFTRLAISGTNSALTPDMIEAMRLNVQNGIGVRNYLPTDRHSTGYGTEDSFFDHNWILSLMDDDLNVLKEYIIENFK